jgi:uncharacterized lipoprotein YajG
MKKLLPSLAITVLSACGVFAQSAIFSDPTVYHPSGRFLNHNEVLAAAVAAQPAPAPAASVFKSDSEIKVIKLLENIDSSLRQQNLELQRYDR